MSSHTARVHLICGATGAGKSTYSAGLAQDIRGVQFSIDEWMQRLHNADQPAEMRFEWFFERVQRNTAQMRAMAEQLCELGIPAIFDCGFTNSAERAIFADWAEEMGYSVQLHFVDVPAETRWGRVQQRNHEQAETFQFEVTRPMFDFIESIWEAPSDAEMARMSGIVVTP